VFFPGDYEDAGQITDDDIYNEFISCVPDGVHCVAMIDCCHSGGSTFLPYVLRDGENDFQPNEDFKPVPVGGGGKKKGKDKKQDKKPKGKKVAEKPKKAKAAGKKKKKEEEEEEDDDVAAAEEEEEEGGYDEVEREEPKKKKKIGLFGFGKKKKK
jgi:hypothetical protein